MLTEPELPVVEVALTVPVVLGRPASDLFRRTALGLLDGLPAGRGRLLLEFGPTRDADSTGLASLIAIRRRARERNHVIRLRGVSPGFRELLRMTKLDSQFDMEP